MERLQGCSCPCVGSQEQAQRQSSAGSRFIGTDIFARQAREVGPCGGRSPGKTQSRARWAGRKQVWKGVRPLKGAPHTQDSDLQPGTSQMGPTPRTAAAPALGSMGPHHQAGCLPRTQPECAAAPPHNKCDTNMCHVGPVTSVASTPCETWVSMSVTFVFFQCFLGESVSWGAPGKGPGEQVSQSSCHCCLLSPKALTQLPGDSRNTASCPGPGPLCPPGPSPTCRQHRLLLLSSSCLQAIGTWAGRQPLSTWASATSGMCTPCCPNTQTWLSRGCPNPALPPHWDFSLWF